MKVNLISLRDWNFALRNFSIVRERSKESVKDELSLFSRPREKVLTARVKSRGYWERSSEEGHFWGICLI